MLNGVLGLTGRGNDAAPGPVREPRAFVLPTKRMGGVASMAGLAQDLGPRVEERGYRQRTFVMESSPRTSLVKFSYHSVANQHLSKTTRVHVSESVQALSYPNSVRAYRTILLISCEPYLLILS